MQRLGPFLIRRLAFIPVGVFLVVTLAFALVNLIPSNPAGLIAGSLATQDEIDSINARLGLDEGLWARYEHYLSGLAHGDLGRSYYSQRPVSSDIAQYLPNTLELVFMSLVVAVVIGMTVGVVGAFFRAKTPAHVSRAFITVTQSIPDFFLSLILIFLVFYKLGWAPAPTGRLDLLETAPPRVTGALIVDSVLSGNWQITRSAVAHSVLPVLALGIYVSAYFAKTTRSRLTQVLNSHQVEFARALGLPERQVLAYAMREARAPLITYAGILFAGLIGGAAIVETIFSWGGIGQWTIGRILQLDIPEIQGFILVAGLLALFIFLAVDVLVVLLDPRVSYEVDAVPVRDRLRAARVAFAEVPVLAVNRVRNVRLWRKERGDTTESEVRGSAVRPSGGFSQRASHLFARLPFRPRRVVEGNLVRRGFSRIDRFACLLFTRRGIQIGVPALIIGLFLLAAFVAPLPHDPLQTNPYRTSQPPGARNWFGTDDLGRDVFSRVIAGGRLDLPLAIIGMASSMAIGIPLGLLASTKSRMSDRIMRVLDMLQAFPLLVLAIVVVVLLGNHIGNVLIAIVLISTPQIIRLVRSEALALRESRFMEAATSIGASKNRILVHHLLPNVSGPILVQSSLATAHALVVIAAMSYLGIGITPPTASWGSMMQIGSQGIAVGQWWGAVFPGLAVFICVLCLNIIADAIDATLSRGARG